MSSPPSRQAFPAIASAIHAVARRLPRIERQQERPREPLFTRVEELIDQILLNPDVSSEHVGNEAVVLRRRSHPAQGWRPRLPCRPSTRPTALLVPIECKDARRRGTLGEGTGTSRETDDAPRQAGRIKKFLHIEGVRQHLRCRFFRGHDRSSHLHPTPGSAPAAVFDSTDDAACAAGAPISTTTLWVAPS